MQHRKRYSQEEREDAIEFWHTYGGTFDNKAAVAHYLRINPSTFNMWIAEEQPKKPVKQVKKESIEEILADIRALLIEQNNFLKGGD